MWYAPTRTPHITNLILVLQLGHARRLLKERAKHSADDPEHREVVGRFNLDLAIERVSRLEDDRLAAMREGLDGRAIAESRRDDVAVLGFQRGGADHEVAADD